MRNSLSEAFFRVVFQDLQPYIQSYPYKIKKARVDKGLTQKELAEAAGVPLSSIQKLNVNNQDALFNCAAVCRVLDVSMDELFGLRPPADVSELTSQIHNLELDNAHKDGEIGRLNAVSDGDRQHNDDLQGRIKSLRFLVLALAGFCTLLVMVVIGYMIFDAHILTVGLFHSAGMSVFAVLLALLVMAAVAAIAVAMRHLYKK
nr:MAG TPA: Helix-turn-helix XRE-family like protein [Caudoviricetes sp.]